ncbi:MAG: thioredoxin domain-containing protein, partial [Clostridia bacterium]
MATRSAFRFSPRPNRASEIHWQPWSESIFARSRDEGRPILLSLSAVWCHWCHVMDETTYSDSAVIDLINQDFIPVRVDNDVRPDINLRYNMGGWPTTAVLTPAGDVLTGGTYVPPDAMRDLLGQARDYFQQHRAELEARQAPGQPLEPDPAFVPPSNEAVTEILQSVQSQFDRAYGGLGAAPKFPQVETWECLLTRFSLAGEGWAAGMTVRTLDAMAGGGLHDLVEGGFFRYCTTRQWTDPHYEKMLDDNARMLSLFLHAFQVTGDETYRDVARRTAEYLKTRLLLPSGLFGGSQDADEAYYQLGQEERANHTPPAVDETAYAGANALASSALLLASALIDPGYRALALTALEVLFDQFMGPEGLLHDDREGMVRNWLFDLVAVGHASLDAFELTGDEEHRARARAVLTIMDEKLGDHRPGFFDHPAAPSDAGRLQDRQRPLAENVAAARLIRRLGLLDHDLTLIDRAAGLLGAYASIARRVGAFGSAWAESATAFSSPLLDIRLAVPERHDGQDLRQAAFALYYPERRVQTLLPGDP